jgi:hypothetical protein
MHAIQQQVRAVQWRQQRQWLWQCASAGLLAGGAAGCLLAIARLLSNGQFSWIWVAVAMIVPSLAGVISAFVLARSFQSAARSIDHFCNLKDRTQTALQFLEGSPNDSLRRLQIEDAERHLQSIDPARVAPIHAPRMWTWGILTSVVAILLAILSGPKAVLVADVVTNDLVAEQAQRATEGMEELEQFQTENSDPELEQMLKEMNTHLKQLAEPGVTPKEALATLSEMEAALKEMQKQISDPGTEAQMKEVGQALSLADPMKAAGEAMTKGDLKTAAEELARMELPPLDRSTQKAVVEKLEKAQQNAPKNGDKKNLKQSMDKLAKGLKAGDKGEFEEGAKGLAQELKQQDQKKELSDLLKKQSLNLLECKAQCESEARNAAQGNRKGGTKAGKGSGGDPSGQKTAVAQTGKEMKLTGQNSDAGEVDTETVASPEEQPEQEAVRQYRSQAQKYEALSESVLESESIPLGHRQTIRRYFEMIRPKDSETDAVFEKTETDSPK